MVYFHNKYILRWLRAIISDRLILSFVKIDFLNQAIPLHYQTLLLSISIYTCMTVIFFVFCIYRRPLRYIDTVFLGQQNHDNQINTKFEKILFIILNLVACY